MDNIQTDISEYSINQNLKHACYKQTKLSVFFSSGASVKKIMIENDA